MVDHFVQYGFTDADGYLIHVEDGYPTTFAALNEPPQSRKNLCFLTAKRWESEYDARTYQEVFMHKATPPDPTDILDGRCWKLIEFFTVIIPVPGGNNG